MIRSISIILTLLVLSEMGHAQGNRTYSGPYQVLDYQGNAQFEYITENEDTILIGPFRMEQSSLDALLNDGDRFFLFEGNFVEGLPQNKWTFQFGEFQKGSGTAVSNYQYNVKINGRQHDASGILADGKLQGQWIHEVVRIENSEVGELLFRSIIQFENGIPKQNFKIEDENRVLLGRFLRDGLAHDQWELYSKDGFGSSETWIFSDGRLDRIVLKSDLQTDTIQGFFEVATDELAMNLDERYTEILRLRQKLRNADGVELKEGMVKMLDANAGYYHKVDEIISTLGKSSFKPEFKVKVVHYPMSDTERSMLDSIAFLSNDANKMVKGMLENTQLRLLKFSDEEVLYLLTLVETLGNEWLNPMLEISQYHKNGILEHVDRRNLTGLWPESGPRSSFEIAYKFDQQQKVRTLNSSFSRLTGDNIVGELFALAENMHSELSAIEQKLNKERAQRERAQELAGLEEQLIAEQTRLNTLIDSLSNGLSDPEKTVIQSIKTRAAVLLREYSNQEEADQKPAQARQLISCFPYMDSLAIEVAMLPERWEEIQLKYRDDVWNPFTAILMSEEIKKHITTSYRQVLIPFYLDQITNNLSCTCARQLVRSLTSINIRMLELKEEDTKKIERKLKKEDDPEVIVELLQIEPPFNQ